MFSTLVCLLYNVDNKVDLVEIIFYYNLFILQMYATFVPEIKMMTNNKNMSTAEFVSSREGIAEIIGSSLDDAQYISLLLSTNSEKTNGKIGIGNVSTQRGRRYRLSVSGIPAATNHKGEVISTHNDLGNLLGANTNRENELHFDSLAHLEVEGETPTGKRYLGVFFSIADACKYVYDEAEKGEL